MRFKQKKYLMRIFSPIRLSIIVLLSLVKLTHAQFLNGPESVTYDTLNSRYLISNVLSGDIVQISDAGDTTFFDRSLTRILGMTIVDSILYVTDIYGLVTFDLTTDQKISNTYIVGMIELNDVTADTSGYLYITDSSGGKIYRMRISDHTYTTIISGINIPNGILFDAQNNRILFCQFIPNAPIKEINLNDFSVNTVLATSYARFDGLAIDNDGYIYVSCWGTNAIYRYDNAFSQPAQLVSSGHNGPADIFYNQQHHILAIPNYYSNHVDFLSITPAGVNEVSDLIPQSDILLQNYPNPFNPETIISYQLSGFSKIELSIYNSIGKKIKTLVNAQQSAGKYSIDWYGKDNFGRSVSSGVYYYHLRIGNTTISKKMILIR